LIEKKISGQKLEDNKKAQNKTKIYKGFFFNSVSSSESRWARRGYVCLFDLGRRAGSTIHAVRRLVEWSLAGWDIL